jgi:hypothetical protein
MPFGELLGFERFESIQQYMNPSAIAEKFWDLYSQVKENWTFDMSVIGSS